MQSYDFHEGQAVANDELRGAFAGAEQAIWNVYADRRLFGIISGFSPTPPGSGWSLSVSAGKAISKLGERLYSAGTITLDPRTDSLSVSTVPSASNRRWVSVFAHFGRNPSDARTDGLGNPILFNQAEALNPLATAAASYPSVPYSLPANAGKLLVVGGTQDLISNPLPARPALDASAILICDIILTAGDTNLVAAKIDTARAERILAPLVWDFPDIAQWNGGDAKFVLVGSYPISEGPSRARVYASTLGLMTTINAAWSPEEEKWVPDASFTAASRTTVGVDGLKIDTRTDTSTHWFETTGTSGWDENASLTASGEIVGTGTTTALFAWEGYASALATYYGHNVNFRRTLAAVPSSITFASVGILSDINVSSGPLAGSITAEGALIYFVPAGAGVTLITRQIITVV